MISRISMNDKFRERARKEFDKVLSRKGQWIGDICRIKSKSESGLFGQPENSSPSGEKKNLS